MNCSVFEKELLAHQHKVELGLDARLHADSCLHCRLLAQSQQTLLSAVADEKLVRVPPFLSTRVMADLNNREMTVHSYRVWKPALQVAAVLLALVGGYSGSVLMDQGSAIDDFSAVLSDYFLMDEPGLSIEEGWLYSESYENE